MDSVIIHNSLTLKMTEEGNDYLHDSYHGPVDKEITAIDLKVVGQIPPDLDGVYISYTVVIILNAPPSFRYTEI